MSDEHPDPPSDLSSGRTLSHGAKAFIGLGLGAAAVNISIIGVVVATDPFPWQRPEIWEWQVAEVRGNAVAIAFSYGDRDDYHGYSVKETQKAVTITVRGRMARGGNCTLRQDVPCLRIQPDAPLGARALLNGEDSHAIVGRGPLRSPPDGHLGPCDLTNARV